MGKILIIFLAIIVIFMVAVTYVLGAIRRFLGISPSKRSGFSFGGFGFPPKTPPQKEEETVIYANNDITVLEGESVKGKQHGTKHIQEAKFREEK